MALNGLFCADVPLRNYSLTYSLVPPPAESTTRQPCGSFVFVQPDK